MGGCDAWLSSYWYAANEDWPGVPNQWFVGCHMLEQPGVAPGLGGLMSWQWPHDDWRLIGYERWGYFKKNDPERLLEAVYVTPNPSTTSQDTAPNGHWHVFYNNAGIQTFCQWYPELLTDVPGYIKGGSTGRKGAGKGKGEDA